MTISVCSLPISIADVNGHTGLSRLCSDSVWWARHWSQRDDGVVGWWPSDPEGAGGFDDIGLEGARRFRLRVQACRRRLLQAVGTAGDSRRSKRKRTEARCPGAAPRSEAATRPPVIAAQASRHPHAFARASSNARSRVLSVSPAARSSSPFASAWRPSLISRSARTAGSR